MRELAISYKIDSESGRRGWKRLYRGWDFGDRLRSCAEETEVFRAVSFTLRTPSGKPAYADFASRVEPWELDSHP